MKSKVLPALGVVVLLGLVIVVGLRPDLRDRLVAQVRPSHAPATAAEVSLAILPFLVSAPAHHPYLAEGLPQELIVSLSRLDGVRVIGRTSSFQFQGSPVDARAVGQRLGVEWLVLGTLREDGNQLDLTIQLVDAHDGATHWSQDYRRPFAGLIDTENEMALALAQRLAVERIGGNARILQTPTRSLPSNRDAEAFQALLQGDFQAARDTEQDLREAIAAYEEAIRLDPSYAMAYARLSLAESNLAADWLTGAEVATLNARATTAAQTALRLAPDLSVAHEALANVEFLTAFERPEAGVELRRAVALAPADAEPKLRLGEWLAARGQIDEGLALLREVLVSDPLYLQAYLRIGMALSGLGRYDDAEAIARKALKLAPGATRLHLLLADIELARGKVAAAGDEAALESDPFWREYALAQVAQRRGEPGAADAALSSYIARHSLSDASQIAVLYALRGDPGHMFEWLDRAVTERDSGVFWWMLGQPFLLAYRDDPRFGALCTRLGIDLSGLPH